MWVPSKSTRQWGERYEFLRGQYDDIKEAEAKLLTMIDELNTAMREQFTEKFAEIRQMFTTVFRICSREAPPIWN